MEAGQGLPYFHRRGYLGILDFGGNDAPSEGDDFSAEAMDGKDDALVEEIAGGGGIAETSAGSVGNGVAAFAEPMQQVGGATGVTETELSDAGGMRCRVLVDRDPPRPGPARCW